MGQSRSLNELKFPAASLDHLVGAQRELSWYFMADCLCGPEIDDEIEVGWLLDGKVGGF